MSDIKNRVQGFKAVPLQAIGVVFLLLLALFLLWFNNINSNQAAAALTAQVYFDGEYCIGDGSWQKLTEGEHIPSDCGDVRLRGNFHMLTPDGEYVGIYSGDMPVAFYLNHINLTIFEKGNEPVTLDAENPLYGDSVCGEYWLAHLFTIGSEEPVELLIHNPHRFGNENAIDELLSNMDLWSGMDFEHEVLESGETQRNIGLLFIIISLILLGSALFSALLHLQNNHIIWLIGLTILAAGIYFTYSEKGTLFWSESIVSNTTILGASMMFYMLFISGIITWYLHKTQKAARIATTAIGVLDGIFLLLPVVSSISFYDIWLFWAIGQSLANIVLFCCLLREFPSVERRVRIGYTGMLMMLVSFEVDFIATAMGTWKGGFLSKYVFAILFVAALFIVLRIIPKNINAAAKARELELQRSRLEAEKNRIEAELKESRISLMLSQIRPHFICNTLGTIERMCLKNPEKAFELVRNFSLYLRGNFSELDSVTTIRFAEELKHVEYYVNIEKVRFPDMDIRYDVKTTDFVLPALSVQPLVENAIKHGLMRLESGGTVLIRSYETETHYCVEVKDDGVGFDTSLPIEDKKHVGLRNIRGRLKAMVNGELLIESKEGVGTSAIIMIPKEVTI